MNVVGATDISFSYQIGESEWNMGAKYQLKAVVFDVIEECRELKKALSEEGILVIVPFFGLQVESTLLEMLRETELTLGDCLMVTNNDQHARAATRLGLVTVGCVEGHFEIPKVDTLLEAPGEVSVCYLNQVYCHAKGFPAFITETERCIIRELAEEDMDDLYEILTDREVAKYLPVKEGDREEEMEKLISYVSCVYSFYGYGYWGVFSRATGELIGRAGFKEGSYPLEAGYVIKRAEWGKGLATEVLSALVQYAEQELDCTEVFVKIDEENKASARVAQKCGVTMLPACQEQEENL
ncbi:MAG: GNAT family N-acetyltransferase [Lachnospiraceae bacterium]|nr:GNAT family N-acetyltransferase [Lachnospiraceae bacterium]